MLVTALVSLDDLVGSKTLQKPAGPRENATSTAYSCTNSLLFNVYDSFNAFLM